MKKEKCKHKNVFWGMAKGDNLTPITHIIYQYGECKDCGDKVGKTKELDCK